MGRLTRRSLLRLAGGGALGTIAASCFRGGTPAQPSPAPSVILPPETLTVIQGTDAIRIAPTGQLSLNRPNYNITGNIYDRLVSFKRPPGYPDLEPRLALRWELVKPTQWRFYLRQGVKFHNGTDFTSDSVVYSFEATKKTPAGTGLQPIDRVEAVDKYTVDFITKTPWFILLYRLNSAIFLEDRGWSTSASYSEASGIGTGPYKFVEWVKGERIVMERNEDYWGPEPPFKRIVWRGIPEASTRVSSLLAGEVDLVTGVQPQDMERINARPDLAAKTVAGFTVYYIRMRLDGIYGKKSFRQGLAHAIDKDAIIKGVMGGFGVATNGHRDPNMLGVDPNLGDYPYDVDRAKKLIAESGYAGEKVVIESAKGTYFKDAEIAQAIGGYFEKAGLKTEVKLLEAGAYAAKGSNVPYEGVYLASSGNVVPDFENVLDDIMVRGGTAEHQWKHPRAVEIRTLLQQTVDLNERIKLAREGDALLKEDAPIIPIARFVDGYGMKKSLDWEPRADQFMWTWEFKFKGS